MFTIPLPCTNPQNYDLYFKKLSLLQQNIYKKKILILIFFYFISARDATFTGLGQGHGVSEYSKNNALFSF